MTKEEIMSYLEYCEKNKLDRKDYKSLVKFINERKNIKEDK